MRTTYARTCPQTTEPAASPSLAGRLRKGLEPLERGRAVIEQQCSAHNIGVEGVSVEQIGEPTYKAVAGYVFRELLRSNDRVSLAETRLSRSA